MANLSEWLAIRVSAHEKELVRAAAAARGVSTSAFVREVALDSSLVWVEATGGARNVEEVADRGV